jgi:hypothetical protein
MLKKSVRTTAIFGRSLLVTLFLVVLLVGWSPAQETAAPMDAETAKALLQRVKDLESEVNLLKAQMQGLADKASKVPEAPTAATIVSESPIAQSETMAGHSADSNGSPRLQLRGYGDVGWNASDQKGTANSFILGQFNLFITSRLTDKASFLSETVVEADPATNQFGIDLERLELIYAVSDRLNLQFGRYHTAIGFYNTAYHHSALMQTALGRPFLFDFEDKGGIIPVHSVGMSAGGIVSSKLGLHYIAEIGNGRNPRSDVNPVQNVSDDNNGKAFNLGFFVRPDRVPGLQFGFANYHDHVTPPAKANVTENILSAHVIYQNSRFEFLNEAVLLRHSIDKSNFTSNISAFYSQVSKQFGNYRPYFRYEYVNVPGSDPLYSDVALVHGPKAGLRFNLNDFTALKIEYGREMHRRLSSVNRVGTQLSFAF